MQFLHPPPARAFRSRVVFADAEVSFGFSAGATLTDVADWVDAVARSRRSIPVAIDVTMAPSALSSICATGASHATH